MILWGIITVGLLVGFVGFKKGLLAMFATIFNLMFAVFISVLSAPLLLSFSPGYETSANYAAGCVVLMFVLIFGLLQTAAWFYFLRDREDYFPAWLDKPAGAVLGFLSGYLACSVILLTTCILPYSAQGKLDWLCPHAKLQEITAPPVEKACNFLAWYSLECFDGDSQRAIDYLLTLNEPKVEEPIQMYVPKVPKKDDRTERDL
jgi:amino acid transporter